MNEVNVDIARDVQMQWGVKIPLRDGVRLNATLYLPMLAARRAPVICTVTPYVGQTYHHQAMFFAKHGYPFLTVDVRGRGNSEGDFHPIQEARDGYDVVEWIAEQFYCDGKVAMWGGSYSGYCQWSTAKEFPPHLATIVPVAAPYRGVDSPVRSNIFAPYAMQWITLVSGRTAQDRIFFEDQAFWNAQFRKWFELGLPFKSLDALVGNESALFKEWTAHPHQDSYWDSYNPSAKEYSKLRIPILTITGMYDANQLGALTHYREYMRNASGAARDRHFLVIGPWDHAGTRNPKMEFGGIRVGEASLLDLGKLHLEWYAYAVAGAPRPKFLKKPVAYYVTGADKWRYAENLDAVTARSQPLYLYSERNPTDVFKSGALAPNLQTQQSDPDFYVYDPRDVSAAEVESRISPDCLTDQTVLQAAVGERLIYHSDPFTVDTEISGFFSLSVWIAIDQPDTDFRAWIYDIGLDGSSVLLTFDSMRARYRESFREQKLICTSEPLCYRFDRFMFVSRLVRRGSRLRLVLGPINSIFSEKNYNAGGVVAEESSEDARPVTVRIFHDETHPSALYVPLAYEDDEVTQGLPLA